MVFKLQTVALAALALCSISAAQAQTIPTPNAGQVSRELQAGRNVNLNSVITTANGNFTASAGDAAATGPGRMAGAANINFGAGSAINVGTGVKTLLVNGVAFVAADAPDAPDAPATVVTTATPAVANPFTPTVTAQYNGALQSVYQSSGQAGGGSGNGGGVGGSAGNNTGSIDPLVTLNNAVNDE